jgi:predicted component of viral defense system (DUF524 family)
MPSCESAEIDVCDSLGRKTISVNIALLPRSSAGTAPSLPPLLLFEPSTESSVVPSVQLLENVEYRYEFVLQDGDSRSVTTDHTDTFQADTRDGRSGRVRPGLYTGTLPIRVFLDGNECGYFSVEVRSRKLGYLTEYRWMVRDLAEQMSAVVMSRFAPAVQQFRVDNTKDAQTLYQRFAFLKALIGGEEFQAALSEIVRRPHVYWIDYHEPTIPNRGIKATSAVARQLVKAGPRVAWESGVLSTLPQVVDNHRTVVSVDTVPNRFVKFALEQWRDVVARISDLLASSSSNPAVERGLLEVRETLDQLDSILAEGLFRELQAIDSFPADNQVLHKREGYRDIFKAYIQFDVAAKLSWEGGNDVYGAGKRDVATLYEYWVFLKLAEIVSELCDTPFDFTEFLEVRENSLNVTLTQGRQQVLVGNTKRNGRELKVELWFNRSFSKRNLREGSWSGNMRPDYSLKISPADDEKATFEPVFLHFDAKYRINHLQELFDSDNEKGPDETEVGIEQVYASEPKRDDLLKMHAYKDAIKRSAGAYVIYPGSEKKEYRQYHELLPGLGAFALKPTEEGFAKGKYAIRRFIEDVFEHTATQISQHERSRFWVNESYKIYSDLKCNLPAAPFLQLPPADTLVLLGYVKSLEHWEWVTTKKLYNLRADDRRGAVGLGSKELACDLIVLSCPSEDKSLLVSTVNNPSMISAERMQTLGYPNPSSLYYCFSFEEIVDSDWQEVLNPRAIEELRSSEHSVKGHPVVLSWLEFIRRLDQLYE